MGWRIVNLLASLSLLDTKTSRLECLTLTLTKVQCQLIPRSYPRMAIALLHDWVKFAQTILDQIQAQTLVPRHQVSRFSDEPEFLARIYWMCQLSLLTLASLPYVQAIVFHQLAS